MKQKLKLTAFALAIVFFVSCGDTQNKENDKKEAINKTEDIKQDAPKKDCNDVHWSHHKGNEGPENWKNLCDGFSDCGGNSQSPINIITKNVITGEELQSPVFSYGESKVDIINNGHTVQFNVDGGNSVNLDGKDYQLLQFHYHTLSEHTVDGKYFPAEVHFVHKHSDTDFAVLAEFIVEGKENPLFSKYLDKFPADKGEFKSDNMIDLLSLLPENKSYYFYTGSLTTPPCSEVVSWYVFKNPVEASAEQISKISKILDDNYRPVQDLNGRSVEFYNEREK